MQPNPFSIILGLLLMADPGAASDKPSHGYLVASDGVKIHYLVLGRGIPVVLIHGYSGSAEGNWFANGVAGALAKKHRVVALDERGHGLSDKPHDPAMYGERLWKDVIELMDHLALDRAHIHGYSMGGGITATLLAQHPERFITASFGGSGIPEMDPQWVAKLPQDKEGTDPQEAEARQKLQANPHRDQKALEAVRQGMGSARRSIDLTKVKIPVLAINGEFDRPLAKTQRMQRELKHFASVVLPGKSHLTAIMAGYVPELYITSLENFINANDPKP
ncbi:MAG TPA: alpha/beta hydrolase [Gemmataceae bacterium]|nr:alpha/beta hydrolase [Gemmataceae bacterium]